VPPILEPEDLKVWAGIDNTPHSTTSASKEPCMLHTEGKKFNIIVVEIKLARLNSR
jgi:hypothetical protein